jgi:hypothetical protein
VVLARDVAAVASPVAADALQSLKDYMYTHTCVCISVRVYVCIYTHAYVYLYVCTYVYTYVYICIYVYAYMHSRREGEGVQPELDLCAVCPRGGRCCICLPILRYYMRV